MAPSAKQISVYLVFACWAAAVALGYVSPASAQRTALSASESLYPRVVRIGHDPTRSLNGTLVASVTSFPNGKGEEQIFSSGDNGKTFARIGTISDVDFSTGLCCGTLYELPTAVGSLRAGTLLWAGSVGGDAPANPMQIKIYRSFDRGATWTYLSNCATGTVPRSKGGLWEPEFTIAANGALVCFYSDETVPGFSQLIHQVTSTDGITWSTPVRTIASGMQADRPGMVVVRQLPSGRFFLTHELCGPAACTVFYKTSPDGIDWTPATNVGVRVETADGRWFLHTPTNAWAPTPGTANGRMFVIGQILSSASGVAAGNGRTIFYNDSADGSGPWKTLTAPVTIQSPPSSSNFCQNYSSPLLPSEDGQTLLGLATDFEASGTSNICKTFFGSAATTAARGGAALSATGVSLAGGSSGSSMVTLSPLDGYQGTMRLTVSIPGFNGTATFPDEGLVMIGSTAKSVQLTVAPTKTAALAGASMVAFGFIGMITLGSVNRRRKAVAPAALLLMLGSCGGSSGESTVPVVTAPASRSYTATIMATDVNDGSITASTTTTVTVN